MDMAGTSLAKTSPIGIVVSSAGLDVAPGTPENGRPHSLPLTAGNLMQHHHNMSRLSEDPVRAKQVQEGRAAQIQAAMQSLDTGGNIPLPNYLRSKIVANSEGMLPIERFTGFSKTQMKDA
jgi:hypothetical protein